MLADLPIRHLFLAPGAKIAFKIFFLLRIVNGYMSHTGYDHWVWNAYNAGTVKCYGWMTGDEKKPALLITIQGMGPETTTAFPAPLYLSSAAQAEGKIPWCESTMQYPVTVDYNP